jgi:hypothetical protein
LPDSSTPSPQRAAQDPTWPAKQLDMLKNLIHHDFEHWMLVTTSWDHRYCLYDLHANQLDWFDHYYGWNAFL